jgi:uncharacterized protein YkwD
MRNLIRRFVVLTLVLASLFSMTAFASTNAQTEAAVSKVNQIRIAAGLNPLSTGDAALQSAADERAEEITRKFSHTRPDGSAWYTVNPDVVYGENLAENFATADTVVNAWMASPAHKANILKADFTKMAISSYEMNGVTYWAEEFCY